MRQRNSTIDDLGAGTRELAPHRWRISLLLAALTATPIAAVLVTVPDLREPGQAAMVAALVAGVLLLLAAVLYYLHWCVRPMVEEGWTVAATVVIGIQVLSGAGFSLASDVVSPQAVWCTAVDAASAAVALGLVACRRVERVGDPLLLGLGLGLGLVGLRALGLVVPGLADLPVAWADLALFVVLVAFLGVARVVLAEQSLPRWAGLHLAAAMCLIGLGEVGHSIRWSEGLAALTGGLALALAAALWTSTAYTLVREAMDGQDRRTAELEESLHHVESDARSVHEQLHEVKSTIAGIAQASRLLEQPVGAETRHRLERTIRAELDRIDRLLAEGVLSEPGPVDLDETLDVLLESHRARGRAIDWKPCGASVHGDRDDVAEVLNILLDNAAKHGGGVPSHVDVSHDSDEIRIAVRDEGPGVPQEMRERIFAWGERATTTAPGQGIGLHVARRLVARHGGSLTLVDQDAPGSAFVVRLPAARRTEENHGRHSAHRV